MLTLVIRIFFSIFLVMFGGVLIKDVRKADLKAESGNFWIASAIGGVAYFLDALGIGGFATSTVMLRNFKQISDKMLPGTLNAVCAVPAIVEALIFISIVRVDAVTLVASIVAAAVGGWLGAAYVVRLPEQRIRIAVSIALFITALVILAKEMQILPMAHADLIGFHGVKLIIAVLGITVIGALGSIGIGFFAPCMSLAFLLGMSAKAIFPIMMSGCAVCTAMSGLKFIKVGAYNRKVTLSMIWCAVVGVLVAAYVVKSLPLEILNWLVMGVIFYTAISLFLTYYRTKKALKGTV